MGKRKEVPIHVDAKLRIIEMSRRHSHKHKKHKHKKHKKNKPDEEEPLLDVVTSPPPPLPKLDKPIIVPKKNKKSRRDSGTSSEEERWLDAIESGKLEEVDDELMKMKPKDPKLMTARQRAMLRADSGSGSAAPHGEEVLVALPSGYKEKVMTAEMVQKAALKSQRRKQQADEKREKDKKKTMDRILKKQESKLNKGNSLRGRGSRKQIPRLSYRISSEGFTLSVPPNMDFPFKSLTERAAPLPVKCGVSGCSKDKRYTCSKTGVPLCSLACYQRNLSGTECVSTF